MDPTFWIIIAIVALGPIPISYLVEALRRRPTPPDRLEWDRSIPISHTDVGGSTIRYIRTGEGPPLLLLHTLRTQLDIFQKVILELAR